MASTLPAQTIIHGVAARATFDSFLTTTDIAFIDFDSVPLGALDYSLQLTHGVVFFSTIQTDGSPISSPHNAYVSGASVGGNTSHKLVGTPYPSGSDDGRVGYEIRFLSPQSVAGLERIWQAGYSVTRFYGVDGILLATHTNTTGIEFVGWIGNYNDPLTWVTKITVDGLVSGGSRQVGYSDDLFFGSFAIPEPSTYALLIFGLGGLWCVVGRTGRKA